MWLATTDFPTAASHPFHTRLNQVLRDTGENYEEFLTKLAKARSQQPIPRRSGSGRVRSYISEPDRGRRNWKKNPAARDAVYRNRRRIRSLSRWSDY